MPEGSAFADPGATATDLVDGAVAVLVEGAVDTTVPGVYTLTYTATDAALEHRDGIADGDGRRQDAAGSDGAGHHHGRSDRIGWRHRDLRRVSDGYDQRLADGVLLAGVGQHLPSGPSTVSLLGDGCCRQHGDRVLQRHGQGHDEAGLSPLDGQATATIEAKTAFVDLVRRPPTRSAGRLRRDHLRVGQHVPGRATTRSPTRRRTPPPTAARRVVHGPRASTRRGRSSP